MYKPFNMRERPDKESVFRIRLVKTYAYACQFSLSSNTKCCKLCSEFKGIDIKGVCFIEKALSCALS